MSITDLKNEISRGWPNIPAGIYALAIIDFMANLKEQELRMLSIPALLEAAGLKEINPEFLAALAILVSSNVHALDPKAFFCEDEGSEFHIDARQLADARRLGSLEHPEKGILISDFEDKLIPYFQSSRFFLDVLSHG